MQDVRDDIRRQSNADQDDDRTEHWRDEIDRARQQAADADGLSAKILNGSIDDHGDDQHVDGEREQSKDCEPDEKARAERLHSHAGTHLTRHHHRQSKDGADEQEQDRDDGDGDECDDPKRQDVADCSLDALRDHLADGNA